MDKNDLLAIGNDRLRRLATTASISVASILVIAKLAAWLMTDSVAMLSSLFDSSFDLIASLITAYGVASALRPPDREHRYGHGKAEPLAALAQAAIIGGSSILLLFEAASRFYHPHPIQNEAIGYAVMGLAIVLTIGLVAIQNHVVSATGSTAITADRLHYVGDLAVNLAVIAAFILQSTTGLTWFDPIFAIAIASALLASAFHIVKHALGALMDAELPNEQRARIRTIALAQSGALGVHDMRTRSDSDRIFIELHVEMDGNMTLRASHDLAEKIITAIKAEIPNADVVVHQDPAGVEEDRRDVRIEANAR
ncbi:MAG: cation diffusion facilitator family transporter [Alphaproteobacteria bacterium]|nr:cation diffusion facilitator family transporter [Alphaproteobacteria bacterium]